MDDAFLYVSRDWVQVVREEGACVGTFGSTGEWS